MNITLITFVTPSSENIRGTSALPYHLIKGSLSLSLPRRKGGPDVNDNDNVDSSHLNDLGAKHFTNMFIVDFLKYQY